MTRLTKLIGLLILSCTVGFHLWLNFPETQIMGDPNDNIFQYSLIYRTNWVWENYGCPWSPSCLINLTDHNVTAWAEGYPLPFYYSHIPQILTVGSYHMIIRPLSALFGSPVTLYVYYNWTKYLLLCLFPIPVFIALRILGINPVISTFSALIASNFSTDGLYGIDAPSYLWRGWGLTSQLYAFIFLPIGLAYVFRLMKETTDEAMRAVKAPKYTWIKAGLFLALTTSGHLGLGMMGLIMTVPFLLIDAKPKNIFARLKKMIFAYAVALIPLSYWIIPMLLNNNYHMISFWDPIWKFNSYGVSEVVKQIWQGEIFDWLRPIPFITIIVITGFFAALNHFKLYTFAYLFVMTVILYFGRTTLGGLIDLIPGMKDFHLHRFVVAIQIASIFLVPLGLEVFLDLIWRIIRYVALKIIFFKQILLFFQKIRPKQNREDSEEITYKKDRPSGRLTENIASAKNVSLSGMAFIYTRITYYLISMIVLLAASYFTVQQTMKYAEMNNKWIYEANNAFRHDEKNFMDTVAFLNSKPNARVYGGRPGNWGNDFRLGSSQIYMLLGINGLDVSQFLPETWSPLSENEQNFDERVWEDYDLLNIKYIVADKNHDFSDKAKMVKKFGPYEVYEVPTSGWFDVVTSPMMVKSDKTNFINIVHLWHRTFPRKWKMHPLISVEKNPEIPKDVKKILTMTDEITYKENGKTGNIFSDFPFLFPDATPSGQIVSEQVNKQSYFGRVKVPENCPSCYIMFRMSYHPDWVAKLDGVEVSKFGIFPFYMGVKASAGEHTVEFTYQPNRLKIFFMIAEGLVAVYLLYRIFPSLLKRLKKLRLPGFSHPA